MIHWKKGANILHEDVFINTIISQNLLLKYLALNQILSGEQVTLSEKFIVDIQNSNSFGINFTGMLWKMNT